MALSSAEDALLAALRLKRVKTQTTDKIYNEYLSGTHKVEVLGLAVPPELRALEFMLAWPRVVVEALNARMRVRALISPDQEVADTEMMASWSANNMESQSPLCHADALTFARSYVSVGAAEEPGDRPLIRVEDPRDISVEVDPQKRRITNALRLYTGMDGTTSATLYRENETVHLRSDHYGRLIEAFRDVHNLGRVPLVMFLNRPRAGRFTGESELADITGLTDMVSRQFMNMQVASEALAVPSRWAAGVSKGDFVDENGEVLSTWETYFDAIRATANKDAKFGQWDAAEMTNFKVTIDILATQMSCVTGLSPEFFGQTHVNPEAEGAIRAGENRMIVRCEDRMRYWGDCWAWVMGLEHRIRTGEWMDVNRIKVEWHDAGTPTFAQKSDALQKLAGGKEILSREGAWDELGWSEARKAREREYLEKEAEDPVLTRLSRELSQNPPPVKVAARATDSLA